MITYAIIDTRTGKYVYGTDFCYSPRHQRTSDCQMITFPDILSARREFSGRECGEDYKIVKIGTEILDYIENEEQFEKEENS